MTKEEKAKIILEHLDEYIQVDWNFKQFYLKGIIKGLKEIEQREQNKDEN